MRLFVLGAMMVAAGVPLGHLLAPTRHHHHRPDTRYQRRQGGNSLAHRSTRAFVDSAASTGQNFGWLITPVRGGKTVQSAMWPTRVAILSGCARNGTTVSVSCAPVGCRYARSRACSTARRARLFNAIHALPG